MNTKLPYFVRSQRNKTSGILGSVVFFLSLLIFGAAETEPVQAQSCGLVVSIIAAPYSVVDSNKPGVEGPQMALLSARIENTSGVAVNDVTVQFSSGGLSMQGNSPSSYFVNDLAAGTSVTAYWPITYPATFGVGYDYTISAGTPDDGCTASDSSQLTTRSQISASATSRRAVASVRGRSPSQA